MKITRLVAFESFIFRGDIQREMPRLEIQINDEIARLTHQHPADIEAMKARITLLQKGIQTWCDQYVDVQKKYAE